MPNHQSSAKRAVSLESTARLTPQRKAACHVFLPYHGGHDVGVGGCTLRSDLGRGTAWDHPLEWRRAQVKRRSERRPPLISFP